VNQGQNFWMRIRPGRDRRITTDVNKIAQEASLRGERDDPKLFGKLKLAERQEADSHRPTGVAGRGVARGRSPRTAGPSFMPGCSRQDPITPGMRYMLSIWT
jgi:hypothetical protein